MVHVLEQEIGSKGPQEHKLKYYVACGCYKQHARKKGRLVQLANLIQLTPLSPTVDVIIRTLKSTVFVKPWFLLTSATPLTLLWLMSEMHSYTAESAAPEFGLEGGLFCTVRDSA